MIENTGPIYMRPPENLADVAERRRLIDRYIAWRVEVELDFSTFAYWNEHVRKPHEAPIDYDPDGKLRQMCDRIDAFLKSEAQ